MEYRQSINSLISFLEAKDSLIKKLNLTDEHKEELINFFKKHPNYENKIDWNRKDLSWNDFEALLKLEGKSKSQAKKKGIEGLVEDKDYRLLYQDGVCAIYYPLTHLGSKVLASDKTGPKVEGKWCISMNDPTYWNKYTGRSPYYDFFFVFIDDPTWQDIFKKVAFCRSLAKFNPSTHHNTLEVFTADDKTLYKGTYQRWLEEQYPKAYKKLSELVDNYPSFFADDDYFDKTGIKVTKSGILEYVDRSKYLDNYGKELNFVIPEGCWETTPYVASGLNFTKITFPKSLVGISSDTFALSYGLKKVEFPEGSKLEQIGSGVFRDCPKLEEVILPEGLKIIWHDAFRGSYNIKKIVLPNTVRTLDNFVFQQAGIPEITLPKDLTYIGRAIFLGCNKLKTINYPGTIQDFCGIGIEAHAISGPMLSVLCPEEAASWNINGEKPLSAWAIDRIADYLLSKGTYLSEWSNLKSVQDYADNKTDTLDLDMKIVCSDGVIPLKFIKKPNWA